ncbi:MAG: phosphoglycerate dehydrogenase [Gemmataceae bacterium]
MPKVLITPAALNHVDLPFVRLLRDAGWELIYPRKTPMLTEDELLQLLPGMAATIAGMEPYTRRVLASAPELRVIARAGVGYDAVDLPAATEQGIAVTITPGTNQDAVAEHTFALMLALAKNLVAQHNGTVAGKWPRQPNLPLRGRTLGIAGLGRIGKSVAVRGVAFGMNVIAYEPYPDRQFVEQYRVQLMPLEQLLAESDFLTLHVPLSVESKHLINKRTLALMKPSSFLINTARGGLVCEADLVEALNHKQIAGAGLDVFEVEPCHENPLFQLDNVVITPHAAGVDTQSLSDMAMSSAQSILALSRGDWPTDQVVNQEVRQKFVW